MPGSKKRLPELAPCPAPCSTRPRATLSSGTLLMGNPRPERGKLKKKKKGLRWSSTGLLQGALGVIWGNLGCCQQQAQPHTSLCGTKTAPQGLGRGSAERLGWFSPFCRSLNPTFGGRFTAFSELGSSPRASHACSRAEATRTTPRPPQPPPHGDILHLQAHPWDFGDPISPPFPLFFHTAPR